MEAESDAKASESFELSSDEEGAAAAEKTVPAKRTRASTNGRSPSGTTKQALSQLSQSKKQKPSPAEVKRGHLDVEDKAGRYRKYYNEVRLKMGYIPPSKHARLTVDTGNSLHLQFIVHAESQNRIHQMLRFFDM